jgi:hypothetical protein
MQAENNLESRAVWLERGCRFMEKDARQLFVLPRLVLDWRGLATAELLFSGGSIKIILTFLVGAAIDFL